MSKKKIVGSKFKVGDKVIIKNRPKAPYGSYHCFDDGVIGVIVEDKDNIIKTYSVKLSRDKHENALTQGIYEKDLIKA